MSTDDLFDSVIAIADEAIELLEAALADDTEINLPPEYAYAIVRSYQHLRGKVQ